MEQQTTQILVVDDNPEIRDIIHDNHNEKLDAWLKEPGREHLIITRGSDCHEIPQVGLVDFVIDEDVKNSMELAQVLKKLV